MMSKRKRLGLVREVLRASGGFVFENLPLSWRQTLEATCESAEIEAKSKKCPVSPKWAIEQAWAQLVECGLSKVVAQTIDYYFPGTVLTEDEHRWLLGIARQADDDRIVVRLMIEAAWRKKITEGLPE